MLRTLAEARQCTAPSLWTLVLVYALLASIGVETPITVAKYLAEDVLLPDAASIDAGTSPVEPYLNAIAQVGLFGLAADGHETGDPSTLWCVAEWLVSGSLAPAFVWLQHQGVLTRVLTAADSPARRAWLEPLRTGRKRAAVAVSGIRPPSPQLRARRSGDRWLLDGMAPWVTAWRLADVVLVAAVSDTGDEVWALLEPLGHPSLRVERLHVIAADAADTVAVAFDRYPVPADTVLRMAAYTPPPVTDAGGRLNGSVALGIARRACAALGSDLFDDELVRRRSQLDASTADDADPLALARARAAAIEFALRATTQLMVRTGGPAAVAGSEAERLLREAAFAAVFGSRRAIRDALLDRLRRTPDAPVSGA